MTVGSLLSADTRVEAPFVRVSIGGYTFGVYEEEKKRTNSDGSVNVAVKYPAYVQSLTVKKINGTVNQYDLSIKYPITYNSDPNFFEKVLSNAGGKHERRIYFSYGDFSSPSYSFRDEEALINKVTSTVNIKEATIDYQISAVSNSLLALSGYFSFPAQTAKPSDVIKQVIWDTRFGLLDVYTGMKDKSKVLSRGWIAGDDATVSIPAKIGVSALDYISFLVSCMKPIGCGDSVIKSDIYTLTTYDTTATNSGDAYGGYEGPYFKVLKIACSNQKLNTLASYTIDIGFPSAMAIESFQVSTSDDWSIYYDYNMSNVNTSDYIKRVDSNGQIREVYSPLLNTTNYKMHEEDKTWWTKVTQFPIQATLTIRGLLKPAILMSYVKVNVWFFGNKHIYSGYYAISSQTDSISGSGYKTTLGLIRVAEDDDMIYRFGTTANLTSNDTTTTNKNVLTNDVNIARMAGGGGVALVKE